MTVPRSVLGSRSRGGGGRLLIPGHATQVAATALLLRPGLLLPPEPSTGFDHPGSQSKPAAARGWLSVLAARRRLRVAGDP